jgi:hypothetical protein
LCCEHSSACQYYDAHLHGLSGWQIAQELAAGAKQGAECDMHGLSLCRLLLQDTLVKIAKKLKKNNVAVDIISFGHEADNEEKLTAFHGAVNSNDNSHLVTVPPGPVLSDVLIGSPIFQVTVDKHGRTIN